jgi:TonB family protein
MLMMTKKRTSPIASTKILIVIPVIGFVFLAISAYSVIPKSSVKQIVPVISNQNSSTESGSDLVAPPPPPPPPSDSKGNIRDVKVESIGKSDEPFVVVEQMPIFPGGDGALLQYISKNTKYPENAKAQNIQGKVIIRFCVTPDGGVSLASVLKGVSPELDAEAMRVVNTLPSFRPGTQGGKAVPVWYMVPIAFTLK